jgi:HEAT repeat protein
MYQPKINPILRYSRYILCTGFLIAFMAYLFPFYAIYIIVVGTAIFLVGFILQIYMYRLMSKYRVKTSLGVDFLFPELDSWIVAAEFVAMPDEEIQTEEDLSDEEIQEYVELIRQRKRKRNEAASHLALTGRKAIPPVLQLFEEEHSEPRLKAALILRHLGPRAAEAVPTLIEVIDDSDPSVRAQIICALGRIGAAAKKAIPILVDQLSQENDDIRICAAIAIGRISKGGKAQSDTIRALERLLEDPVPSVQTAALITLIGLGEKVPNQLELLISKLHDSNAILALLATENLGIMGKSAKDAIPELIEAMKVPHPIIQVKVSHALYRIGYDPLALLRPVLTAAKNGEVYVKMEALEILEDMGLDAEPAIQAYVRMLGDKNTLTRVVAVRGISFLGEKARPLAPQLRRALTDPAKAVQYHAEETLKALGEPLEEPTQLEAPEASEES